MLIWGILLVAIISIAGVVSGVAMFDPSQAAAITADDSHARGSADIHLTPDGRFLYASNRLQGDGIAIFSVDKESGMLTRAGYQATARHPRNFAITPNGRFLLCACRDADTIQVFAIDPDTGMLSDTSHDIHVPHPVCIAIGSK